MGAAATNIRVVAGPPRYGRGGERDQSYLTGPGDVTSRGAASSFGC